MKTLSTFLVAFILFSCSSDSNEDAAQLSFEINDGLRFATSEISVTNTTTNYSGDFVWEVTSASESLTFSTPNLTFTPRFAERYTIVLKSSNGDLEFSSSISISRPNNKTIRFVRLKDIPQNYEGLYFTIEKRGIDNNPTIVFSSARLPGINAQDLSGAVWEVTGGNGTFPIVDPLETTARDFESYTIRFYDDQDNLVTRLDPIFNSYPEESAFDAGDFPLNSSTQDCMNCASFEIIVEIEFGI